MTKETVRGHFEAIAGEYDRWKERSAYYYELLAGIYREFVPPGADVLEVGCGTGTLLASLRPRRGAGIDISPRMIEIARAKFPELDFSVADAENLSLADTFDYIIIPDVIEHLSDAGAMLRAVRGRCRPGGRVIVTCVNPLWAPVLHLAERLGLKMPEGEHRWLPAAEIASLARNAGFSVAGFHGRILCPKRVPLVAAPLNRLTGRLGFLRPACLTQVFVLTPRNAPPAPDAPRAAGGRRQPWARRFGLGLMVLGAALLTVVALGKWSGLGSYENLPPRPWEHFDPALAEATPDIDSLHGGAQARAQGPLRNLPPAEALAVIYEVVADRLTHGSKAQYGVTTNWVLWLLGKTDADLKPIYDPDTLLRGGHSVLCGGAVQIMRRLADRAGIRTRYVHLEGHVVLEGWYDGGWHVYDPDLEIIPLDDSGKVPSVDALAGNPDLIRGAYAHRYDPAYREKLVSIFTSTEDNRVQTDLPGIGGESSEQEATTLAFAVPLLLIACGAVVMKLAVPPPRVTRS